MVSSASARVERPVTRTFAVGDTTTVRVKVFGGSIQVNTGASGEVEATLTARVRADSSAEATALLADFDIVMEKQGNEVVISAQRKRDRDWVNFFGDRSDVSFRADIRAPEGATLDLDTSGGSVTVRGERLGAVQADTSGGSIKLDGGRGDIAADTSGGSITIGRALGILRANTSGGSITVGYVGPTARKVDVDTSGGGIRIGVDPRASLRVNADTSGGGVSVEGLALGDQSRERSHVTGVLNGGDGSLRASTSGGSIRIAAAEDY